MDEAKKKTPMMEQWHACKQEAKEALLLFRMGDFYECFYEDAVVVSRELELTLTKRQEVPMSGVPWHAVESYIDKLLLKGYKVALAEQLEDPKAVKGLVKRGVVRILTPGTVINSSLLSEKTHNFIATVAQVGSLFGLAVSDLTTGDFFIEEHEEEKGLFNALYRLHPREIVVTQKFKERHHKLLTPYTVTLGEEWSFDHKMAYAALIHHYGVQHLDGFGLKGKVAPINAAGALLRYLQEELCSPIDHLRPPHLAPSSHFLSIESQTWNHLELPELLKWLDHTCTPMGGRRLNGWLQKPLLSTQEIKKRQEAVTFLVSSPPLLHRLEGHLKKIRDLERLMMKIGANMASPKECVALRLSLEEIAPLREALQGVPNELFSEILSSLFDVSDLTSLLKRALHEEPPLRLAEGDIFLEGYDKTLDEWRMLAKSGKEWMAQFQAKISQETGAKNLRVVYNKVFGYTIEVSRGQAPLLEGRFEKRQTLTHCERFTSTELKEYENKILIAEERKLACEKELFEALRIEICLWKERILAIGQGVSHLDALFSLSLNAVLHHLTCPEVVEGTSLEIFDGRHPLLEALLSRECFIANHTLLEGSTEPLMVITGPNMAGKSTYIRQVALIVILAQMGSFVPATRAKIGVVDKIFTRIGAHDDLTRGQSTFMVEMSETANILNHVTSQSLVILDEIGRGTSTYDGLAIAWAVAEFLLAKRAKTLFATHYFELTALEITHPGTKNYHAAVKEMEEEIVFLHKIVPGKAARSYGIHVARLAGLPSPVLVRAQEIMQHLEQKGGKKEMLQKLIEKNTKEEQLLLFS